MGRDKKSYRNSRNKLNTKRNGEYPSYSPSLRLIYYPWDGYKYIILQNHYFVNIQCNISNGKLKNNEWKLLKSQTTYGSANVIELPANYIELYICYKRTSDNLYMAGTVIPRIAIASNINYGYGNDINGYSLKASWNFNANTLTPFKLCVNGVDVTNQYTYEVYYR